MRTGLGLILISLLVVVFVGCMGWEDTTAPESSKAENDALAAAKQIVIPAELMKRPDGMDPAAVVEVTCPNGVMCGPIWPNSVCGGKSCIADEGEACCMICQCIGQLGKWCASPSGCTP